MNVVVPFQIDKNRCLVDVWVNGKGPFKFLLDTGSTIITITPKLAELLQVPKYRCNGVLSTLSKKVNVDWAAKVAHMRLGNAEIRDMMVGVMKDVVGEKPPDGEPVCGILGYAAFRDRTWTFDGKRQQFIIHNDDSQQVRENLGIPVSMHIRDGIPFIKMSIEGRKGSPARLVDAIIDTGMDTTIDTDCSVGPSFLLPKSWIPKSEQPQPAGIQFQIDTESGSDDMELTLLDGDVKIGSKVFHEPVVGWISSPRNCAIVGMITLKRWVMVFDPHHETLWIPCDGPSAP
ncbi:MAG: retropepsin-like domain-containing protein [Phycisphaerales bacterium]|nr:retropepsin-like domain-containing protein [Phycisphaerales bacterium]